MISVSLFVIDIVVPYIPFSLRSRLNVKFTASEELAMLCSFVLIVALAHQDTFIIKIQTQCRLFVCLFVYLSAALVSAEAVSYQRPNPFLFVVCRKHQATNTLTHTLTHTHTHTHTHTLYRY